MLSIAVGSPDQELVAECHRRGIKVIAMVTTVADALTVEAAGVDAVVAQGAEGGGHRAYFEKPPSPERGAVGTLALVPQLVDALHVPVIAAGGIADGRGLVAALALGATGALLGSRFVATRESMAFAAFKKALLEESGDDTSITDAFTGRYARVLRTAFVERYGRSGAPVLPFPWQYLVAADIYREAVAGDHRDYFPLVAGQSVGLINNLPTAAEVVESVIREARAVLQDRLPRDTANRRGSRLAIKPRTLPRAVTPARPDPEARCRARTPRWLLPFRPVVSGAIKLNRADRWRKIAAVAGQHAVVAA